jgi:hypothetical protein
MKAYLEFTLLIKVIDNLHLISNYPVLQANKNKNVALMGKNLMFLGISMS